MRHISYSEQADLSFIPVADVNGGVQDWNEQKRDLMIVINGFEGRERVSPVGGACFGATLQADLKRDGSVSVDRG